ncbi:MAG: arginine--tRNA ligase, partial [gamma proteobacterium symbiont of Bathyaustriella thionipta]|nr:arginine--tRNA ligase [gamma proteobacterium symbiont of Bathyaustriella thionipta]
MKEQLRQWVSNALHTLADQGVFPAEAIKTPEISETQNTQHGDYACNIALILARAAGLPPRDLAARLVAVLSDSPVVESIDIAGPGFINFRLAASAWQGVVQKVLSDGQHYGHSRIGQGKKVLVEYVSANPTGPLHVGHGRGAAYGSVVADLLQAVGYQVEREYYVNDAGRQMDILAVSVWLRYLELCDEELLFPSNGYRGDYVWDIAATLHREHQDELRFAATEIFLGVPQDETELHPDGDKEAHIDALISKAKTLLGDDYRTVFDAGLNIILDDIRDDLGLFGSSMDNWYSERQLMQRGLVQTLIQRLQDAGHIYTKEGAQWFRSTAFGDEKDRVVVRENGQTTYFASDIAYHLDKIERGFDWLIDVWGADHHGYVPRVKAAMQALGLPADRLKVLLVQFANLYRGGEKVQMSTRSGQFVTLRELRKEVGADAARFFYVMRRSEQHLDFDLDLAKSQSNENPVFYVQYAHARIASVLRQAEEKHIECPKVEDSKGLERLENSHEQALLKRLAVYPEILEQAASQLEPHQIANYLRELAAEFHGYYNAHAFLVEDEVLRSGRLMLILAVQQVLRNA